MTFLVKQPEGMQWTWNDHHWSEVQSSPYRKMSNFHPVAEKTVTSSISTTTAAPVWVWGRGMLYISACTECCVYPVPFQWPARGLPLCLAVPALPWVKESPELGKPSGAGGHSPGGRKPAARADTSRCLQEAENDRAKSLKKEILSYWPRDTKGEVVQDCWVYLTACCHQKCFVLFQKAGGL